jgi:hypothetical protein
MWWRAKVSNAAGKDAAEDVQVIVRAVSVGASTTTLEDRDLGGFALMWTAIDEANAIIPPGVHRYINICYVFKSAVEHRLRLHLHNEPGDARPEWAEPVATIELVVAARNANPVSRGYRLTLSSATGELAVEQLPKAAGGRWHRLRLRHRAPRR